MQGICVLLLQPFINKVTTIAFTHFMRHLCTLLLLLFSSIVCAAPDTSPQPDIDMRRYAGRWYEQARYENWFEKGMDEVYTDYMLRKDGSLTVKNAGRKAGGNFKQSEGRAFPVAPGELSVSFVWPYWWFRAPYKILYTDSDYSSALVAGQDGKYLWMLTRDKFPDAGVMNRLHREAQRRGFDTGRLRYTKHQKRKSTAPDTKIPG